MEMAAQNTSISAPRPQSTANGTTPVVQQASGSEGLTTASTQADGEEFELSIFEPTDPDEEDRWAALPQRPGLSREARHALHNTSIDPENPLRTAPATHTRQETTTAAQDREARRQQRLLGDRAHEERQEAIMFERRRLAVDINADAAAHELNKQHRVVRSMLDVYNSSRDRYEREFPRSFSGFKQHAEHAAVISQEDVRFYSMLLWYQRGPPQYLLLALRNLVRAMYEDSRLREELAKAEKDDVGRRNTISQADAEAAAAANVARTGGELQCFGMETDPEVHITTIGAIAIPHFDNLEEEEKFIRACFEVRKVRLEHEDSHELRHPHHRPYEASLDHSMEVFCRRARATYLNESGRPRQPLSSSFLELLQEIETHAGIIAGFPTRGWDQGWFSRLLGSASSRVLRFERLR